MKTDLSNVTRSPPKWQINTPNMNTINFQASLQF